jgi:ribonuclease R
MLPERLSADLCSLRPDRDRLALSLLAELDNDGKLHGYRFAETIIRSRHKLHYAEVQEILDGQRKVDHALHHALEVLQRLARALRRRRRVAGALELDVPETKAWVDANGVPIRIERRTHLESHELIEEFMLLANRCVGREGAERRSGVLFRIHEPPSPAKLEILDRTLQVLGLPRLGRLDDPARALQALLAVPLDDRHRGLLHRMVLRALPRARYAARDHGHFGLATREYCHFTSPIRRYPDLHNHRRVREWIRHRRDSAWDPAAGSERAEFCSDREEAAVAAEREAVRVKGLRVLEGRLGDRASGMITGLVPRGFFVELDDPPVDGFVRVGHDLDDRFELDAAGVRMIGRRHRRRFTLGDTVNVIIARVDVPARECDLALEPESRRPRGRRTRRG